MHDALDISQVENFTLEKMLAIPQNDTIHGGKIRIQFFKRPCPLTLKPRYYSINITGTEEKQCAETMPELFRVKIKILKDKIQEENNTNTYSREL
jgi:hypothetical protein